MKIPRKHTGASEHETYNCNICESDRYRYNGVIWVPKWLFPCEKCQCCAPKQDTEGKEKRRKIAEFIYFLTAGPCLLIISAVAAYIAISTLSAIKAQIGFAEKQIEEMQRESRLDERAWVTISNLHYFTWELPRTGTLSLNLFNSGKTPAYIDNVAVHFWANTKSGTQDLCNLALGFTDPVPPNGTVYFGRGTVSPMDANAYAVWTNTDISKSFAVTIQYHDAFTKEEITEFRFAILGGYHDMANGIEFQAWGGGRME